LLSETYPAALTVDAAGQIYLTGTTFNDLPVTANAFGPSCDIESSCKYYATGFLLKLDPSGTKVLYATYLNGLYPYQVTVDSAGFMYVLANHTEPDFYKTVVSFPAPITPNAVQTYPGTAVTPTLLKIAPTGELIYGTFLGGIEAMPGGALTVDGNGSAIVCGSTADPYLTASPGAYQRRLNQHFDVFAAKLSPDGSAYQEFTFLGGDGIDRCAGVQLDAIGNVYLYGDTNSRFFPVTSGAFQTTRGAGWNLFVAKLDPAMHSLAWSTYIGGNYDTLARWFLNGTAVAGAQSMALAADGSVVFCGLTQAFDFPVSPDTSPPPLPGSTTPVLGVLDPTGSLLTLSYALPVTGSVESLVTGDGQNFYLVGNATVGQLRLVSTLSAEGLDGFIHPTSANYGPGSIFPFPFVAEINVPGRALTYMGPIFEINGLNTLPVVASGAAPDGGLLLASWSTGQLPTSASVTQLNASPGPYDTAAVLFKADLTTQPTPAVTAVVNPANMLSSDLVPGQAIEVRGIGLAVSTAQAADQTNPPVELGGTQLLLGGTPIQLLSVSPYSLSAVLPEAGLAGSAATLSVVAGGSQTPAASISTAALNPALFTASGTGVGQALARNADGSANSAMHPAARGGTLRVFATGLGTTNGQAAPAAQITAAIEGAPATVLGVAAAGDGYPAGYYAVDIAIPLGAPADDFVLVTIAANGTSSQSGVTVSLR
jgi:uncharacterized protein (TIGR03437 family)